MFGSEIRNLLIEVIRSWQVLAVTVVLVIYISIVNYVARLHYHSSPGKKPASRSKKQKSATPVNSETDELGLEEEGVQE